MYVTLPLPLQPLPSFEGDMPEGVRLFLTGKAPQYTGALHKGEVLTLLVVAKVSNVAFPTDAKGKTWREHTAKIAEAYVVAESDVEAVLEAHRDAQRVVDDSMPGQTSIGDDEAADLMHDDEDPFEGSDAEAEDASTSEP